MFEQAHDQTEYFVDIDLLSGSKIWITGYNQLWCFISISAPTFWICSELLEKSLPTLTFHSIQIQAFWWMIPD